MPVYGAPPVQAPVNGNPNPLPVQPNAAGFHPYDWVRFFGADGAAGLGPDVNDAQYEDPQRRFEAMFADLRPPPVNQPGAPPNGVQPPLPPLPNAQPPAYNEREPWQGHVVRPENFPRFRERGNDDVHDAMDAMRLRRYQGDYLQQREQQRAEMRARHPDVGANDGLRRVRDGRDIFERERGQFGGRHARARAQHDQIAFFQHTSEWVDILPV